jgi:hypothetical protein
MSLYPRYSRAMYKNSRKGLKSLANLWLSLPPNPGKLSAILDNAHSPMKKILALSIFVCSFFPFRHVSHLTDFHDTSYKRPALRPCRSSAVRRWLPTAAARVCVRAACGVCGGQSGTGVGFL